MRSIWKAKSQILRSGLLVAQNTFLASCVVIVLPLVGITPDVLPQGAQDPPDAYAVVLVEPVSSTAVPPALAGEGYRAT